MELIRALQIFMVFFRPSLPMDAGHAMIDLGSLLMDLCDVKRSRSYDCHHPPRLAGSADSIFLERCIER